MENDHKSYEYGLAVRKSESRVQRLEFVQVCEESEHQEYVNLETIFCEYLTIVIVTTKFECTSLFQCLSKYFGYVLNNHIIKVLIIIINGF